jgi:hypothetical protein
VRVILWLNWMWIRAGAEFTTCRGMVIAMFPLLVYFILCPTEESRQRQQHATASLRGRPNPRMRPTEIAAVT